MPFDFKRPKSKETITPHSADLLEAAQKVSPLDSSEANVTASSASSAPPLNWNRKTGKASSMVESFYHAFHGIAVGLKGQRNIRIHFAAVAVVSVLAVVLNVDSLGWISLTIAMALVISAEFLNTALENLIDVAAEGEYHRAARDAKDTAAAAVLVASLAAAVIGGIVFIPRIFALLLH